MGVLENDLTFDVIVPAAGSSSRFGEGSKLDADLGGRPVLQRTVELFVKRPEVRRVVVAGPADEGAFAEFKLRYGDKLGLMGCVVVQGSAESRAATVRRALEALDDGAPGAERIVVHDAARPLTPIELIERVFSASAEHGAVVPGVAVADTLKRVGGEAVSPGAVDPLDAILGDAGKLDLDARMVVGTVSREGLYGIQTPQVFEAGLLRRAYAAPGASGGGGPGGVTDDAGLVEALGEPVAVIEGSPLNIKITTRADLELARAILDAGRRSVL